MADVDMTDAPPVAKKKGGDADSKKRFEVKKVRAQQDIRVSECQERTQTLSQNTVERRGFVGLGHRCR